MKKKAKPAAEKYNVEAVFLGERVDNFGQIYQLFRTKSGRELNFTKVRGALFGESFLTTKSGLISTRPVALGEKQKIFPRDSDREQFELHKELAKHVRLKRQKAMEIKKPHRDIVRALELLRPFARNADAITIRRFADYLANQLTKGRRK